MCGVDNSLRKWDNTTADCSTFKNPLTCIATKGCKYLSSSALSVVDEEGACVRDLLNTTNAGLDMRSRPYQYYTDPSTRGSAVLCTESCPTSVTIAAAGITLKTNIDLSQTAACDPADAYCQNFCLGPSAETQRRRREDAAGGSGSGGYAASAGNPYGLVSESSQNQYATTNFDAGNCYDNNDADVVACSLNTTDSIVATSNALSKIFGALSEITDATMDALGIGSVDDFEVSASSDWAACKAAAVAGQDTLSNPNCANTGCPKHINPTYDVSSYTDMFGPRFTYTKCIPSTLGAIESGLLSAATDALENFYTTDMVQEAFSSVASSLTIMGYGLAIAVGLSYFIVILMKFVIRPMIVVMMVLSFITFWLLEAFIWYKWQVYDDFINALDDPANALPADTNMMMFFKVMTYVWGIFCVILSILMIAMRKKIWIAATLYMEASKAMFSTPSMLIAPLVHWGCTIVLLGVWSITAILIATTDTAEFQTESLYGEGHAKYNEQKEYYPFIVWHFFMGLWGLAFFAACNEFVLAGCITQWYKAGNKTDDSGKIVGRESAPSGSYFRSVWHLARYHLGSVALGSMIIAVCQAIIAILMYVQNKAKHTEDPTGIIHYVLKCLVCCMWCLEKCLKFINRNAYIEINLYGYSFCNAAVEAFKTMLGNFLQVAAHHSVGMLVFFFVKLLVIGGNCSICYLLINNLNSAAAGGDAVNKTSTDPTLDTAVVKYIALPLILIGLATYFIVSAFTELFEMTADTLLICICEDREHNGGKDAKESDLLAPKSLLNAMNLYNKQLESKKVAIKEGKENWKEADEDGFTSTATASGVSAKHRPPSYVQPPPE